MSDEPKRWPRVVGNAALGLLLGALAAALAGGLFTLGYHPHGGGDIGDWTALAVLIVSIPIGGLVGLGAGIVWGVKRFALWRLAAGLGVLGVVAGGMLIALIR